MKIFREEATAVTMWPESRDWRLTTKINIRKNQFARKD